ncbi:FixJ family two-component response regulator [Variovorax sp. OAS795]|uniref:response regulator transcription factor n=1 Tax=Variovorax sp. OAS795 TaxID=3034231 RepID=UPI00339A4CB7
MADPLETLQSVVAVVDDDRRMLEGLQDLLESAGHAVRVFSSASAFLASDSFEAAGCLICDICMPGMDGWGLQRLASLRRPELPVILMTAHVDEAKFISSRCIGRKPELFKKPFDGPSLLRTVDSCLRRG